VELQQTLPLYSQKTSGVFGVKGDPIPIKKRRDQSTHKQNRKKIENLKEVIANPNTTRFQAFISMYVIFGNQTKHKEKNIYIKGTNLLEIQRRDIHSY
jgi:hypothetical protein